MINLILCIGVILSFTTKPIDKTSLLDRHNYYRHKVGVPNLEYSNKCETHAQKWAEHLAKENNGLSHSGNRKYGENCFTTSGEVTASNVVDFWASEIKYFNNKTKKYNHKTGHYTQIIWRDTKFVGVGMAIANDGTEYWVCNYFPAGNYINKKVY